MEGADDLFDDDLLAGRVCLFQSGGGLPYLSLSLTRVLALVQDKELQDEDDNLFLYLDAPLQRVFGGEQARPLLSLMSYYQV